MVDYKGLNISNVKEFMDNTKFIYGFGSLIRSHAGYVTVTKQGGVFALILLCGIEMLFYHYLS